MSQGTVLVTAATGFTGGATVEEFLARGRHVRALAHREDARSKRLQELGAEVVFGDFLDLDSIRAAVQGGPACVFLLPHPPRDHPGDGLLRPGREGGRHRRRGEHVAGLRPRASNSSTVAPPVNPVAPVTKTVFWFMCDVLQSSFRCRSTSKV